MFYLAFFCLFPAPFPREAVGMRCASQPWAYAVADGTVVS